MARSSPRRERFLDHWLDHPGYDLAVAVLISGGLVLLRRYTQLDFSLASVDPSARTVLYGGVATVSALAAGANNTAVGSYVSSSGPVVDGLRQKNGKALRLSLRSIGAWLWVVSVTAIACIALDPLDDRNPGETRGAAIVVQTLFLLLALKFSRLSILQDLLLRANDLSTQRIRAEGKRRQLKRRPKAEDDN